MGQIKKMERKIAEGLLSDVFEEVTEAFYPDGWIPVTYIHLFIDSTLLEYGLERGLVIYNTVNESYRLVNFTQRCEGALAFEKDRADGLAEELDALEWKVSAVENVVDKIRYAMDNMVEQHYVIELLKLFDADSGKLK